MSENEISIELSYSRAMKFAAMSLMVSLVSRITWQVLVIVSIIIRVILKNFCPILDIS